MKINFPVFHLFISLSLVVTLQPSSPASAKACKEGQVKETPQTAISTLRLPGLRAAVKVSRDGRGIPYIEAASPGDCYFAQGYVTASDRLWQMDFLRRVGRGEVSEILGRAALEEDKLYRTFGFAHLAEAAVGETSPSLRAALESYARGINAFIDGCDDKTLPQEFQILKYKPRPWRLADSLIVEKVLAVTLSTSWPTDIMRAALIHLPKNVFEAILPESSPLDVILVGTDEEGKKRVRAFTRTQDSHETRVTDEVLRAALDGMQVARNSLERVGLYSKDRAASNNWVVSGKRTASGKPLLANDPHLSPSAPCIWYLTYLSAPALHVAGATIPGVPGIVIGHNEKIAWGSANLGADVQDLYSEEADKQNPVRYKTPAGWSEAGTRLEEIKVRRGITDSNADTVSLKVTTTRNGPVILERAGQRYALRWTALNRKATGLEAFLKVNRARNWNEFRDALREYKGPAQNFVYADVAGHIGYYGAGEVPIRKTGDGSLPYQGWTDEGEWVGYIPFDKMPQLYDPPSGIIVTANNRLVGFDYPYVITREWAQPYRARRIHDLLQAEQSLTTQDFLNIQGDTYSISGMIFSREVVEASLQSAKAGDDINWIEILESFRNWDGRVNSDSRVPLILGEMRDVFRGRVLGMVLTKELLQEYRWMNGDTLIDRVITERPPEWLPKEFKDYADFLHACYLEARDALLKYVSPDEKNWQWGQAPKTKVRFMHPLANVPLVGKRFMIDPFPQNGSYGNQPTVNAAGYVSMRFIADTSDWNNTRQGITLGQSGDPSSEHWKDQLEAWRAVTPQQFPFTRKAVTAAAKQLTLLVPK
jgi:penicillin G amidase